MLTPLEEQLIRHEGLRDKAYIDTEGYITIGVGHNLSAKPVKREIIMQWFREDVEEAVSALRHSHPWVDNISQERREVFINMVFNLGIDGFNQFKNMIKAAKEGDWAEAAAQALDSKWRRQVKGRALELARQLETGERQ